jgi:transposase
LGNPTGFHLTAGQRHELIGADALMSKLTISETVLADKAYDADKRMRYKLQDAGCIVVIPSKKSRRVPIAYDRYLYGYRHLIENFFAKLKQYRAIATRYDKTATSFLGAIHLASSIIFLN